MNDEQPAPEYDARTNAFKTLKDKVYFHWIPSYAKKIYYSLGFMALTCLLLLAATGTLMGFMGQTWWLFSPWGIFVRSVHLWTVQAFIFILILHILVAFSTSAFRAPRRMVWVFGATIFCLVLLQTEFGYGLRGDFASQFRAVSGADFWNGAYLGYWLNPLNYTQTFIIHVAIIPLAIFFIFIAHYILEHTYGIARPYRKDVAYKMVPAGHRDLFVRASALVGLILVLAFFFHSPYVPAVKIADVAQADPNLVATTLQQEYDHTSDTATYLDSIDPYRFDTREVYVIAPYREYLAASGKVASTTDPATMIAALLPMAKSGLYESILNQESPSTNYTYTLRFLNDMDIPETKAATLNMSTEQSGMMKDETGSVFGPPPGSWWLSPLAFINHVFNLPSNPNGDRDAAFILGFTMLVFILFPYIPYLNRVPEFLPIARFIWKEPTEKKPPGE